jgi:GntR family transcriptional regulator / MocR family aminotransferase
MASAAAPAGFINSIVIDRTSRTPFYQQLYEAVRQQIERGMLQEQNRLPSVGEICSALELNRATIRRAFHKLENEGFLEGSASDGYVVCRQGRSRVITKPSHAETINWPVIEDIRPIANASPEKAVTPKVEPVIAPVQPRSELQTPAAQEIKTYTFNRVSVLDQIDLARLHASGPPRPFRPGLPATDEFPIEIWEGLRNRLLRQRMAEMLDFTGTFGYLPLRQAIASRLRNARGVKCSPEQVIICAGAQQALNLVINTLVSPGDAVGLEEPGYYGVKAAFLQAGAKVAPLLVDDEGVTVPDSRRQNPPLLVYTTPANQFPLGASLTLPRRMALLEYARKTGTWIIEDDSDGDFSYMGRPLPSLQGADEQNRVIYLGTTGKTLFPSLEIGYVVVPLSLMESFSKTKEIMGGQPCVIDQAVLAAFIEEGYFDRHLQRMNTIYHQRLQTLGNAVDTDLRGFIDLEPANAGLHAVGWLARGLEEGVVANGAARAGVELPMLSSFGRTALVRPGVVFGFASFGEKMIQETVRRFSHALKSPDKYPELPAPAPLRTDAPKFAMLESPEKTGFFQRLLRFKRS